MRGRGPGEPAGAAVNISALLLIPAFMLGISVGLMLAWVLALVWR